MTMNTPESRRIISTALSSARKSGCLSRASASTSKLRFCVGIPLSWHTSARPFHPIHCQSSGISPLNSSTSFLQISHDPSLLQLVCLSMSPGLLGTLVDRIWGFLVRFLPFLIFDVHNPVGYLARWFCERSSCITILYGSSP